jgi:hypothetical protein
MLMQSLALPTDRPNARVERAVDVAPPVTLGRAELDLSRFAQAYSADAADNLRWSLVRRTPTAAQVYRPETGVDWHTLQGVTETGTILVPAGFGWSFSETFQYGPGYKEAGGVLAGGHCALATLFHAAAEAAGLPTEARRHARPIPGFAAEQAANIWWGRDDLGVSNTLGQDVYFVWHVAPETVSISLELVSAQRALPALPDFRNATIAVVYGRPEPGGWGSLGQTAIADHGLYLTRTYAERVDGWNGPKPVVVAINPNVAMQGELTERELYVSCLIAEARRQGYYVMLDVQPGEARPLALFETLLDRYLYENVWFDWDIEHTAGGPVSAQQINEAAAAYFSRRQARGYQTPGVFGFYVFSPGQVTRPAEVRREYAQGVVVPLFDGYGGSGPDPARAKIARTQRVLSAFGAGPFGIMEFETRWGTRYDQISAQAYLEAFPEALMLISQ